MFKAKSVAIVGASESSMRARNAIRAMASSGVTMHLVNRRGEAVMGRSTTGSLSGLAERGIVVDAALIFTNAAAAIDVTAEAATLGVGGVIVNANGFAEAGPDGQALQNRLARAAGRMPLLGPNCNGILAPRLGLHLAGSPPGLPILCGKLAFVTHSGATMIPMGIAALERKTGLSYLVSTGNEAVVDMAEVIEFLSVDASTAAICLLIETIRNPPAFWAAIDAAIGAGKPVLAVKNGRSSRGQAIAKSHTGAVAGEAWIYESALHQHGVILASDLVDLADRAVLFDQVPRPKWTAVKGLAITSGSGGWVTMASDVCAEEGVDVPELAELRTQIREAVPGATVVNPLDLTGTAMTDPNVLRSALCTFVRSDAVDTVLIQSTVSEGAEEAIKTFAGPSLDVAAETDKLLIVGSLEGGAISSVMQEYLYKGIAVTRGMRATARAIKAMSEFVNFRQPALETLPTPVPLQAPADVIVHPKAGRMVGFEATMALLKKAGVPVAPYAVVRRQTQLAEPLPFDPPYVAKLAEVPHRSDIGAVCLGVSAEALGAVIEELRALAARCGESPVVVLQPQYRISSELLVGIQASEIGPVVICGLGGVFVEVLRQVGGCLAPLGADQAGRLVSDINANGVLDGPRGTAPWPKEQLAEILRRVGDLALAAQPWLQTLDINPLALTPDGIVAVDGLAILS